LSDEELMRLLCNGERSALEELYDRYFAKLCWFASRFLPDTHRAEDAVQEVFIKLIEKPALFDDGRKFSTWIYAVTGNQCRNELRNEDNRLRLLKQNTVPFLEKSESMNHRMDYNLLQKKIDQAYEDLNEKEKQIYVLRFEQELSIREVAAIVAIPEGSVKSGIFNLLKKISKHLTEFSHAK
jgi:RNA polymerase sigma-70 factor, ECF subfamily